MHASADAPSWWARALAMMRTRSGDDAHANVEPHREVGGVEDDGRRGEADARGPVDGAEAEEDKVELVRDEKDIVAAAAEAAQRRRPEQQPREPRDEPRQVVDVPAPVLALAAEPIRQLVEQNLARFRQPGDHVANGMEREQGHHQVAERAVQRDGLLEGEAGGAPERGRARERHAEHRHGYQRADAGVERAPMQQLEPVRSTVVLSGVVAFAAPVVGRSAAHSSDTEPHDERDDDGDREQRGEHVGAKAAGAAAAAAAAAAAVAAAARLCAAWHSALCSALQHGRHYRSAHERRDERHPQRVIVCNIAARLVQLADSVVDRAYVRDQIAEEGHR